MDNQAQGAGQVDFISLLDPQINALEVGDFIVKAFGDQYFSEYMLIQKLGAMRRTRINTYSHFEDTRATQYVEPANTVTAAGAGLPVTFNLAASSYDATTGNTYIRERFTLQLPDYSTVWVSAVTPGTPPTVTVYPNDPNATITITAGDRYNVGASQFGGGTGQPIGITGYYPKYSNNIQIMKESYEASGTAITDEASINTSSYANDFKLGSVFGVAAAEAAGLGNTIVKADQARTDIRMMKQINDLFFWGQQAGSYTQIIQPNGLNGETYTTNGLYQTVDTLGQTVPYTVGAMTLLDFETAGNLLDQQVVPATSPVMWFRGRYQATEFENLMMTANANTMIKYTTDKDYPEIFANSSKDANFSFQQVTKAGYTFMGSTVRSFTDVRGMGSGTYDTPNLGFMIPLAKGKDAKFGTPMDSIALRYKSLGAYNRVFKAWSRDQTITNKDTVEWNMQCELGPEFFAANRFIKLEGS